jgi:hypothetical protein|tara:strand:- start:117 stop:329 length:213 start_codon:yes stop_codon:yes gene_type:complete
MYLQETKLCHINEVTYENGFTEIIPYDITPHEEMELFERVTPVVTTPSADYRSALKTKMEKVRQEPPQVE